MAFFEWVIVYALALYEDAATWTWRAYKIITQWCAVAPTQNIDYSPAHVTIVAPMKKHKNRLNVQTTYTQDRCNTPHADMCDAIPYGSPPRNSVLRACLSETDIRSTNDASYE